MIQVSLLRNIWKASPIFELIFLDGSGIDGRLGDGLSLRFSSPTEATATRTLHWVPLRVELVMVD